MLLFTSPVSNPKTAKSLAENFATYILHLAPASLSGHNTCPKATAGCEAACLNTAGRGGMFKKGETTNTIQKARIRKTQLFFSNRELFMQLLVKDIQLAKKQAAKKGLTAVFRLNGTSDLSFEKYPVMVDGVEYSSIFAAFPGDQFYDYTKVLGRKVSHLANYHLTFSAADGNDAEVSKAITNGMNVAVVFGIPKSQPMPASYDTRPVYNGDMTDLRFLDPKGVVVGLYAKGRAKKDATGFVKRPVFMMAMAA